MLHRVFLYGTLKRGQPRASLLRGQRWVAAARTEPRYRLFSLGPWPGLVEAERPDVALPGASVHGEVWAVDDACLAQLDWVEDVDEGLYERRPIALLDHKTDHDAPVEAYFYCGSIAGLADCGTCW